MTPCIFLLHSASSNLLALKTEPHMHQSVVVFTSLRKCYDILNKGIMTSFLKLLTENFIFLAENVLSSMFFGGGGGMKNYSLI